MSKIICFILGHNRWRKQGTTHDGFDLYTDHYIEMNKCERCGANLLDQRV